MPIDNDQVVIDECKGRCNECVYDGDCAIMNRMAMAMLTEEDLI